jgi:hypothetical protein
MIFYIVCSAAILHGVLWILGTRDVLKASREALREIEQERRRREEG